MRKAEQIMRTRIDKYSESPVELLVELLGTKARNLKKYI